VLEADVSQGYEMIMGQPLFPTKTIEASIVACMIMIFGNLPVSMVSRGVRSSLFCKEDGKIGHAPWYLPI